MLRSLRSARHQRLVELLIRAREESGLTQAEVAGRLGRHQPFVSNIESGQRRVDVVELLDLADTIGFDPAILIQDLRRGEGLTGPACGGPGQLAGKRFDPAPPGEFVQTRGRVCDPPVKRARRVAP